MGLMPCALQALTCCALPWHAVLLAFMNASAACVCMQLAQPEVPNLLVCRPLHTMLCPAMSGTYRLAWLT